MFSISQKMAMHESTDLCSTNPKFLSIKDKEPSLPLEQLLAPFRVGLWCLFASHLLPP